MRKEISNLQKLAFNPLMAAPLIAGARLLGYYGLKDSVGDAAATLGGQPIESAAPIDPEVEFLGRSTARNRQSAEQAMQAAGAARERANVLGAHLQETMETKRTSDIMAQQQTRAQKDLDFIRKSVRAGTLPVSTLMGANMGKKEEPSKPITELSAGEVYGKGKDFIGNLPSTIKGMGGPEIVNPGAAGIGLAALLALPFAARKFMNARNLKTLAAEVAPEAKSLTLLDRAKQNPLLYGGGAGLGAYGLSKMLGNDKPKYAAKRNLLERLARS